MIPKAQKRGRIDKSALAIGEPKRVRDKAWKKSANGRPCDACGVQDGTIVAAHIRKHNAGTGLKPSDDETLFLCFACHNRDGDSLDQATDRNEWLVEHFVKAYARRRYQKWRTANGGR